MNEETLELIEERRKEKEAERIKKGEQKLKMINEIITFKNEDMKEESENKNILNEIEGEKNIQINVIKDSHEEENNFPLKNTKSEEISFSKTEKIFFTGNNEVNDNKNKDNNLKSFQDIKKNIDEVNRRKVMLGRAKTILVTKNDKMKDNFTNRMKEKEKRKQQREEAKANVKKKNKFDSFFMVCLTTIIGYFIKYLINIVIAEKNLKIENYMYLTNCGTDTDCFQNIIMDKNLTKSDINLFNKIIENLYIDGEKSFIIIIIIYAGCIISSILLYSFFICIFEKEKKKENEKNLKNSYRVCEICGYII